MLKFTVMRPVFLLASTSSTQVLVLDPRLAAFSYTFHVHGETVNVDNCKNTLKSCATTNCKNLVLKMKLRIFVNNWDHF